MRFTFANRTAELRHIEGFLTRSGDGADRICIVSAPSGVGKSRLVDEAVGGAGVASHFTRVRVKNMDFRSGESGFFLRACAIAISDDRKARKTGFTLEKYGQGRGGVAAAKAVVGAAAKKLEKVATGDSDASTDTMSAWKEKQATLKEVLGEASTPALRLAFDYLEKLFASERIVLAIENSQMIDNESWHFLLNLTQTAPSLRLVFEYTVPSQDGSSASGFDQFLVTCLEAGLGVVNVPLGSIDFELLSGANFRDEDRRFVATLRNELSSAGGNIREVERLYQLASQHASASAYGEIDQVRHALLNFSTQQRLTLWIIALSRRSVDPFELTDITSFLPAELRPAMPIDMASHLAPFIEVRDGLFAVDHDSLLPRLEEIREIRREYLVAATALSSYYKAFLERQDFTRYSEYEILFALIWLSIHLKSPELLDLAITRLAHRTRATGRPAGLLRLVNDFMRNTGSHALIKPVVRKLFGIIYDGCWLEGAIGLAREYRELSADIRLCYCQALSVSGRHADAEAELTVLRAALDETGGQDDRSRRLRAYLDLTSGFVARFGGKYELAVQRYLALDPAAFRSPEDQCLYYRFGEIVGASDAAERLSMARRIAMSIADKTSLVRADIALAMIRAESGQLDEARVLLDEAQSASAGNYVDEYMILNNRLAIEVLDGDPTPGTYGTLRDSLPLVVESTDRLLVTNTLLAAAVHLDDSREAVRLAQILEEALPRIVEPNMRRLSYFNASKFHEKQGVLALARDYRGVAFGASIDYDQAYWRAREAGSRDPRADFRLSAEFDLPMMSNWYFSWPDFDMPPG